MKKRCENEKRFGKEQNGAEATASFSEGVMTKARELLASCGNAGRREIVRASLELDRLLGEAAR